MTTTITKGKAKKIKSGCQAQAWGAIAKNPWIGKVYDVYPTATSRESPWGFAQDRSFTAYVTRITVQPTTTPTTSSGQFSMNANG